MNSVDGLPRAICGIHAGGGVREHEKLSIIQSDADQDVAYAGVYASTELVRLIFLPEEIVLAAAAQKRYGEALLLRRVVLYYIILPTSAIVLFFPNHWTGKKIQSDDY